MLQQLQDTEELSYMTEITNAFKNKKAFIGFITAGDPTFDKTVDFIFDMEKAGADIIELGIPFSDPIADGEVIQAANLRAMKNGVTIDKIFEVVKRVRAKTQIPLVFLTYLNPVYHYGYDKFLSKCNETGLNGIVCPDLPLEEKDELNTIAKKYNVDIISLVAPTSESRIKSIAQTCSGFIYVVSSLGVTGTRSEIKTDLKSIINVIKETTDVPAAVGFGISTPEQARSVSHIADGVIVGSAIVKIIEQYGENADKPLYDYVKSMKDAIK